ncbi:MAG: hypothetical protein ABEJ68_09030 [Halobacteriaceae archaeon]
MADSVRSALRSGLEILREDGVRKAAREAAFYGWESALRVGCSLFGGDRGDNVYDDDWDVLLILDACRTDLMAEVQDEYAFLDEMDARWSVGSTSAEWLTNTFDDAHADETAETVYVTGNPFSESDVDASAFAAVDELWRTAWDDDAGTIRPRPLTDRAIERWRDGDAERLVVHYMQPHYPFIDADLPEHGLSLDNWGAATETNVWTLLRDGTVTRDDVWSGYRENLRTVLDDVSLLLESIDADTVAITADHGNALGEYGVYGHPGGLCLSPLREVPWVTTSAERTRDYDPDTAVEQESEGGVEDRLEALGYK